MIETTSARPPASTGMRDDARDFDFLNGHYHVRIERLAGWPEGQGQPEEFAVRSIVTALPGGLGRIDQLHGLDTAQRWPAVVLRLFEPGTRRWSLYRFDAGNGTPRPPLEGSFRDNVGVFEGWQDPDRVRTRLTWSRSSHGSARCEEAFSYDNGSTWEPARLLQFVPFDPRLTFEAGLPLATWLMFSDPAPRRA